jgi:ActR/RegA family two-component response regulator
MVVPEEAALAMITTVISIRNITTAVRAVKFGAHDYLTKPVYVDDTAGIPLAIG